MKQIEDPIQPIRISHDVEEVFDDSGQLREHYNSLVYTFERGAYTAFAKTYLDTIHQVSIHGPSKSFPFSLLGGEEAFMADVMTYLKRRFQVILALKPGTGYEPIWRQGDPDL